MSLSDKTVIITGATSGIGAACVGEFLQCGAKIVLVGRDKERADRLLSDIRARNGHGLIVLGDVSQPAFCEAVVKNAVDRFGRVDVLVNSAGIIPRGNALELTDEQWLDVLSVNVSGTFWMCRAAIRAMRETGGGSIVNVASDWGLVGGKGHVAYCASKGAVVNMTRALALDHIADGIRVNVICPGEVNTPMLRGGLARRGFDPVKGLEELGRGVPIGRVSDAAEQARCIRFLASDDASYVVGAVLSADGGSTAR
jgi:meso-butanediol dehydrogenase/(S,S)-butanediol dehydrogenase/diacetyl reductase